VDTRETLAFWSSQVYAVYARTLPKTIRYSSATTDAVLKLSKWTRPD